MKIYLSGAITGTNDYKARFDIYEKMLHEAYPDAKILNPVKMGEALPELSHDEYMIISFAMMEVCDYMYQIPGWEKSRGCNQERGYAFGKHIRVLPKLEIKEEP